MSFHRYAVPFLAATALAACAGEVADESEPQTDAVESDQTVDEAPVTPVAAETGSAAETESAEEAAPNPYATGKPGQPAIPETREDPNWTQRYSPDVPYYNRSGQPIPATMGASPRTALVGQVMPNDGGFIQTCEINSTYCKITFGGNGKAGYVNMDLLSGEAR